MITETYPLLHIANGMFYNEMIGVIVLSWKPVTCTEADTRRGSPSPSQHTCTTVSRPTQTADAGAVMS